MPDGDRRLVDMPPRELEEFFLKVMLGVLPPDEPLTEDLADLFRVRHGDEA